MPSICVFVCSFQVSPPSRGVQDLAELAHDPAVLLVGELDVVEDRVGGREALAAREVALDRDLARAPGLPAVGGRHQDRAVADRPRVLGVGRIDVEQVGALHRAVALLEGRVRLLLRPRLAAVGRGQDEAVLPGDPAVVLVDEAHAVERGVGSRRQELPVHAAVASSRRSCRRSPPRSHGPWRVPARRRSGPFAGRSCAR